MIERFARTWRRVSPEAHRSPDTGEPRSTSGLEPPPAGGPDVVPDTKRGRAQTSLFPAHERIRAASPAACAAILARWRVFDRTPAGTIFGRQPGAPIASPADRISGPETRSGTRPSPSALRVLVW